MAASYIDPVIASRIRVAWGNLPADQRARISARLNAKKLAYGAHEDVPLQALNVIRPDPSAIRVVAPAAGLKIAVDSSGELWGDGRYEHLDPGWAESIACWVETIGSPYAPFPTNAQVIQIPDTVKIAIAGDWGTGDWRDASNPAPSTKVAAQMAALKPDVTIHLGDTYYAGTEDEVHHLLTSLWPEGSIGSFALNGNHEMYSGGQGYFTEALWDAKFGLQKRCSFFALENSNWIIVGLDSAYYADPEGLYMDGTLPGNGHPDFQSEFLREQVAKGKKVIVLTHHNGLTDDGSGVNMLWAQVVKIFSVTTTPTEPSYWYWGHSHMGAVYKNMAGTSARCVGHGGVPYGPASVLESPNVEWYEKRLANDPEIPQRCLNGFATLDLSGPNIKETFVDENGGVAWSSLAYVGLTH